MPPLRQSACILLLMTGVVAVVRMRILVVCLLLGTCCIARGDEPNLSTEVEQLVRQLNADEITDRQAAEKELVALGTKILELLPTPNDRMPQEMKLRLSRVRDRLEEAAARATTEASLVTLAGEFPLSQLVAKLHELTGNKVIDFRNQFGQTSSDPVIKVDFQDVPFWQALDFVIKEADLKLYAYSGEMRTIALVQLDEGENPPDAHAAYSGLFRFAPQTVRAVRNLRNPNNDKLTLTVEITWEPRILPIAISHPLDSLSAQDEAGNAMPIDTRQQVLESSVQNTVSSIEIDLPLELPARDARKIASLKGEITALVPGREATFTFDKLMTARNVERKNAGVTVVLQRVRKNADVYQVRVLVRFSEAGGALESYRGWIYSNEAYLLDPDGKRVDLASLETTRQQIDEVGLAYNFVTPGDLQDHKFVYKTPAAIVSLPVKYELKDLELP